MNLVQVQFRDRKCGEFTGREFSYIADIPLEIGDVVNLQMATNGTEDNIYDDEVLGFKLVKDYREN